MMITCDVDMVCNTHSCAVTTILCGGQCDEGEVPARRSKVGLLSPLGYERLDSDDKGEKKRHVQILKRPGADTELSSVNSAFTLQHTAVTCRPLVHSEPGLGNKP